MKRALSTLLAAALVWLSPGLGLYEALAKGKAGERVHPIELRDGKLRSGGAELGEQSGLSDGTAELPAVEGGLEATGAEGLAGVEGIGRTEGLSDALRSDPLPNPSYRDKAKLVDRLAAAFPKADAPAAAIGETARKVSAIYGEKGSASAAGDAPETAGAVDGPPAEAGSRHFQDLPPLPLKLDRSTPEKAPTVLFRVWGAHEIQRVGPVGTVEHMEFKAFAALVKVFGLYLLGLDFFGSEQVGWSLSLGYMIFYIIKGPPFLFVQRTIDKIVRIALSRSTALDWYGKLKGAPSRRKDLASIPGVLRVVETVRQRDIVRGWRSLWGVFPREARLSRQYVIEATRDIREDVAKLNAEWPMPLRLGALAVRLAEGFFAGLNPFIVVAFTAWGMRKLVEHGINFAPGIFQFVFYLRDLPFLQLFGPLGLAIGLAYLAVRTSRDFGLFGLKDPHPWLQGPFPLRVEPLSPSAELRVELGKGPASLRPIHQTTAEKFLDGFMDEATTRRLRQDANADPLWLLNFASLAANWAAKAMVFATVANILMTLALGWNPRWFETLFLVYLIVSMIDHKARIKEIWRASVAGFKSILGRIAKTITSIPALIAIIIAKSAADKRVLLNLFLRGANGAEIKLGAVASGYGVHELAGNGFAQQAKLFIAPFMAGYLWLILPAMAGGTLLFGFVHAAAVAAFAAMALAAAFERPMTTRTALWSIAFAVFGAGVFLGHFEIESWKAAAFLLAGAAAMISRQLALRGVSQEIAKTRMPGALQPAHGLPTPTFRSAGKALSQPPAELLKDLVRSLSNIAAVVAVVKLGAFFLGAKYPFLATLSMALSPYTLLVLGPPIILAVWWARSQNKRIRWTNRRDSNNQGFWRTLVDLVF